LAIESSLSGCGTEISREKISGRFSEVNHASPGLLPLRAGQKTCRVHCIWAASASRGTKRSTRPTRSIRWEPCQTAAGWRGGLQTPSKGKSPPARKRRPRRQQLAECTPFGRPLQGVRSVKKGKRNHQEQSGVNRVGRQTDGEERRIANPIEGERPSCKAKTDKSANNLQSALHSGGLCKECKI
jgi:hypothetical protein